MLYAVNYTTFLNNLKSPELEDVKGEVKRLGIGLVFLPPYSPDLNPIEYRWKSKRALCQQCRPRT